MIDLDGIGAGVDRLAAAIRLCGGRLGGDGGVDRIGVAVHGRVVPHGESGTGCRHRSLPAIGFTPERNPHKLWQSVAAGKRLNDAAAVWFRCGRGAAGRSRSRDAWTSAASGKCKRRVAR
ncbi:hypothetical protein WR25_17935 [Diploscapter pachys]|uniref:Uncharacterized protein n=1 Tax=Diploscapter pachys TaxID=2018661 RepID=A0A2A2M3N9_9BILA|nr:hypothetical protein WR25_17935 [Diploscapter pachys]